MLLNCLNSGAQEAATLLSWSPTSPSLGGFADSLGSRLFVRLMKYSSSYTLTCFIAVHTKVAVSGVISEPVCVPPRENKGYNKYWRFWQKSTIMPEDFLPSLFFSTIWCLLTQCQEQNGGHGSGDGGEKKFTWINTTVQPSLARKQEAGEQWRQFQLSMSGRSSFCTTTFVFLVPEVIWAEYQTRFGSFKRLLRVAAHRLNFTEYLFFSHLKTLVLADGGGTVC